MKSYRTIEAYRNPREAKEVVNSKFKTRNSKLFQPAFTLVEVLIVVAILGILAAIVLPEVQGYTEKAKENAAKDNLRILREAIGRYAVDHNDTGPGYESSSTAQSTFYFKKHLVVQNEYLSEIPQNPLNDLDTVKTIGSTDPFPTEADGTSGWIYKLSTQEIRLNYSGSDSEENTYFSY